jgi:hypothetical protein
MGTVRNGLQRYGFSAYDFLAPMMGLLFFR